MMLLRLSAALTALQLVIFVTLVVLSIWTGDDRFGETAKLSFLLLAVSSATTYTLLHPTFHPNKKEGTK